MGLLNPSLSSCPLTMFLAPTHWHFVRVFRLKPVQVLSERGVLEHEASSDRVLEEQRKKPSSLTGVGLGEVAVLVWIKTPPRWFCAHQTYQHSPPALSVRIQN